MLDFPTSLEASMKPVGSSNSGLNLAAPQVSKYIENNLQQILKTVLEA